MTASWRDYIHLAIQNRHPGASIVQDYTWITGPDGEPYMQHWNEAKLGPLDIQAIQTEAERLMAEASKPPVPSSISDRQFAQGLALRGLITEAEALAWVKTGVLPAPIEGFVSEMQPAAAFSARMVLSGATLFERQNSLVAAFGQLTGMDEAALDDFWRECAAL